MEITEKINQNIKYLNSLSKTFPNVQSVSTEIINLRAILDLPKGTEHFVSDIHGEHEAFVHIVNSASGVIHEKIDILYGDILSREERKKLATLIYYPALKLNLIKNDIEEVEDIDSWYRRTLIKLIEICRLVSSKYTRSKVRKTLPKDFAYIIDELLHAGHDGKNKEQYYNEIISTIIEIDRADAFIIALADVIKRLAVDRLHIVGDIFDRGERPDIIMDLLMQHHSVDIQWGNHDILWMGAASGSEACICNVLNICLRFSALDLLEIGYGISLRPLITFAEKTYTEGDCFKPKQYGKHFKEYDKNLIAKMRKAITVILFKMEGQIIKRNPKFEMESRLLLDKINYEDKTVTIDGVAHPIMDDNFPTVDKDDPYALSDDEKLVMNELKRAFLQSEKLQRHTAFLYSKGSIYKCYNSNLLIHGCIPMNEDGSFTELDFDGNGPVGGKKYFDFCDQMARNAFFLPENSPEKERGKDFIWYLWCGKHSPLFGRHAMTTFERCEIKDEKTWKERKDPYYNFTDDPEYCRKILAEFGLDPYSSHIINGHVPVKIKDGESPLKANGKLINIDGGFCKHYQKTTGIAGNTLIYNSYCLRLVSHQPFESTEHAIKNDFDITSTSHVFENVEKRKTVGDTDTGTELKAQIDDLMLLLKAYRLGIIRQSHNN